jgi:tetratricopeptide (TPR) repeat protein
MIAMSSLQRRVLPPLAVMLAGAALVLWGGRPSRAQSDRALDRARQLARDLQYEEARDVITRVLPEMEGRERARGLILLARLSTSPPEARSLLEEVVRQEGTSTEGQRAALELAWLDFAQGDFGLARERLGPIDGGARELRDEIAYLRGLSLLALGEYERAVSDLEEVRRGPYLAWSYLALGEAQVRLGDDEGAFERYRTLADGKVLPTADYRLGEAYERAGRRGEAARTFRNLVATFPRSPEAALAREKVRSLELERVLPERDEEGRPERSSGVEAETVPPGGTYFTVQIGAFLDRSNALKLVDEVGGAPGPVFVVTEDKEGRRLHRVRVGRYATREEADDVARRLERAFGLDPHVVKVTDTDE